MARNVETTILDIETSQAQKSVNQLRSEIKALKDQLLNCEEGTQEYADTLNQLGTDMHALQEVSAMARGASADFGDVLGNVTGVIKGASGAVQTICGALSVLGVDLGKDAQEMTKFITSLLAVTNGIAAIDSGIKSFTRLASVIKAVTAANTANTASTMAATSATTAQAAATTTATTAQIGLNTAMKANPILAIVSLIAAATTAIIAYTKATNSAKAAEEERNKELERQAKLLDDLIAKTNATKTFTDAYSSAIRSTMGVTQQSIQLVDEQLNKLKDDQQSVVDALWTDLQIAKRNLDKAISEGKSDSYVTEMRDKLKEVQTAYDKAAQAVETTNVKIQQNQMALLSESVKQLSNVKVASKETMEEIASIQKAYSKMMASIESGKSTESEVEWRVQKLTQKINSILDNIPKEKNVDVKVSMSTNSDDLKKEFNIMYREAFYEVENYQEKLEFDNLPIEEQKKAYQETLNIANEMIEKFYNMDNLSESSFKAAQAFIKQKIDAEKHLLDIENKTKNDEKALAEDRINNYLTNIEKLAEIQSDIDLSDMITKFKSGDTQPLIDYWNNLADEKKAALEQMSLYDADYAKTYAEYQHAITSVTELEQDKRNMILSAGVQVTGSILGGLSQVLSQYSSGLEQGTKEYKNVKKAEAIIAMLTGMLQAFTTAQQLGPILGPVIGGINMATVASVAGLQIAQIDKTNVSKNATTSVPSQSIAVPTASNIQSVDYANNQLQQAVNANTNGRSDQRVYVTTTDIENAFNEANRVVVENTY